MSCSLSRKLPNSHAKLVSSEFVRQQATCFLKQDSRQEKLRKLRSLSPRLIESTFMRLQRSCWLYWIYRTNCACRENIPVRCRLHNPPTSVVSSIVPCWCRDDTPMLAGVPHSGSSSCHRNCFAYWTSTLHRCNLLRIWLTWTEMYSPKSCRARYDSIV